MIRPSGRNGLLSAQSNFRVTAMEHRLSEILGAIAASEPGLTKLESRIAAYLMARPETILVETSAEVARTLDISPMTVTRFYRKLGFDGVQDARTAARRRAFGPETRRIDQRFASAETLQSEDDRVDLNVNGKEVIQTTTGKGDEGSLTINKDGIIIKTK